MANHSENMSLLFINFISKVERSLYTSQNHTTVSEKVPSFVKHWGLVLHVYKDEAPFRRVLLQANDFDGLLKCEISDYDLEVSDWKNSPGFKETTIPIENDPPVYHQRSFQYFVESVNDAKRKYQIVTENCHEFVGDLMSFMHIDVTLQSWFKTAKQVVAEGVSWSVQSVSRSLVLAKVLTKNVLTGLAQKFTTYILKPAMNASFSALESSLGRTLAAELISELERVIVVGTNEVVEGLLRLAADSFTYWQFLQIIAEVIVRALIESDWFKDKFGIEGDNSLIAYCGGKGAAFSVCLLVAACYAGGGGIAGAAIIWVAQELITFGLRVLFGLISTCFTVDQSDYFDEWLGPSMSLKVFNCMFGTNYRTTRQKLQ